MLFQKIGWSSPNNEYLGLLGVAGESIRDTALTRGRSKLIGEKVGSFLRKLHKLRVSNASSLPIKEEVKAWQERYLGYKDFID